jgi:glycine cleavage system H protein
MSQTRYTRDHEYVQVDGDVGSVGISDHAQSQLGDVVFVELPKVGAKLAKGAAAAVVESVKAASDVYTPVSGEVIEVNDAVEAQPGLINEDSAGKGWLMKIRLSDAGELDALMDEGAYAAYLATLA